MPLPLIFEKPNFTPEFLLDTYGIRYLNVDEALVNLTTTEHKIWMYSLSAECYKCPFTRVREITPEDDPYFLRFDTAFDLTWKMYDKNQGKYISVTDNTQVCSIRPEAGQFGLYDLIVDNNKNCRFSTVAEPVNINLSLLLILFVVVCFVIGIPLGKYIKRKRATTQPELEVQEGEETNIIAPKKKRLKSLDTFRGIAICLMIFANSGSGHYWWIEHATWNGLHVADIVFPFFLWIMGVCIPISIKSQLSRNVTRKDMFFTVLQRSIKLFILGLCLGTVSGSSFETLRIFGVLQRFGIAYFCVASLHIFLTPAFDVLLQGRFARMFMDVYIIAWQWIVMMVIVALHLILIYTVPVPDCPKGYFGPGGKYDNNQHPKCIGGATGYIDIMILTEKHIYQHPTAKTVYDSMAFDPEGVFGCLLTVFHAFLGLQAGMVLTTFPEWKSRIIRWVTWGTISGLLGLILSKFSIEEGWIPINKNLWSLSFVLVTSSLAFYLLSFCYFVIDIKRVWSGIPFFWSGMNAILMYIGHTVTHQMLPWHWRYGDMNTHFALLVKALWNMLMWMAIAFVLYRKKIFYSV